jgi:uncharacterized protein YcnI
MKTRFVGFLLCILVGPAWGHIDVEPRQSIARRWETYTLRVPTETKTATVKIHAVVPRDFEIEMVEHSQVWHIDTVRDERGFVREITWRDGRIPPQTFAEVKFLARNPASPGLYRWDMTQYEQTGEAASWTAQTQIVALDTAASQRVEEAWRAAQTATTVSLLAIGVSTVLILVSLLNIFQTGRRQLKDGEL